MQRLRREDPQQANRDLDAAHQKQSPAALCAHLHAREAGEEVVGVFVFADKARAAALGGAVDGGGPVYIFNARDGIDGGG